MAQFEEASPICRGKNLSWETILLFYNNMPREPMPKSQFNSYTEARINGWTQTHSQIARQLAFYYEENGICYPRFTKEMSFVDLFKYMQNWAAKYFIPNPYAPSLKGQTPTSIYEFILEAIKLGKTNFDEILDSIFGITLSSHDKVRVYLNNFTDLIINGNSVSLNTRTIGIESSLYPDEACAIDTKRYYDYFDTDIEMVSNKQRLLGDYLCLQKIYFGTPGSGKSWTIKQKYEQDETKVFRTTFHPDTDYASFVGCYKPVKDDEDEKKIVYEFVPQAFTDAYVAAWSDLDNPYYLIIEEINRGNCAQIFGDLFQLLDRNKYGYSEYPIKADHDLKDYLEETGLNRPEKNMHPLFYNSWGGKLSTPGVTYVIKKYADMARMESPTLIPKSISPHVFRHSRAVHLLQGGANLIYIRDFLGHVSVQTTEIYARISTKQKNEAIANAYQDVGIKEPERKSWEENPEIMEFLDKLCSKR